MKQNIDLIKSAQLLANMLNNNEKLATSLLAARAKTAAYNNPEDQSVRMVYTVLNKMAENDKLFITKNEFKQVCQKFSSTNSMLPEIFASELDVQPEAPQRKAAGEEIAATTDLYSCADQEIANSLSGLWDENGKAAAKAEAKTYNPAMAKQAQFITTSELERIGAMPRNVDVFCGNKDIIICDATYETPKGQSHILVPVELSSSGALIPTVIVNKFGFSELTKSNISSQIVETAGKNLKVNAEQLLNLINITKEASTYNDTQLQLLAFQEKAQKDSLQKTASNLQDKNIPLFANDGILYQELDQNLATNVIMAMPKHEETDTFAKKLGTAKGVAEFQFGKQTIEGGRNVIVNKLASFGYNAQASIADCDTHNITYAVKISTANGPMGFEVLADVANNRVALPSVVAVEDKVFDFTQDGIDSLIRSQASSNKMVAVVSPLYELKTSDILDNIREAANNGDYTAAEEALTVLAQKDVEAYNKALVDFMRCLANASNPLNKYASTKCGCTKVIKIASYSSPICGHLNLPLDKVYQNEKGECCPLYRKSMDSTYEGVLFSTSKVLG